MTAFAAIFGMIPVALSSADGSEWRNAMGSLIIGGLTSSTLLTLIVVPASITIVLMLVLSINTIIIQLLY